MTDEPEACMSGWEVERPDMVSVPREVWEEVRGALISIEEYWNRDQNERAMANACWHAANTARQALARLSTTADEGDEG